MKKLPILLILPIFSTLLSAQPHVYEDLLVYYVDEEYEKCVKKGERYVNSKATRNDPLPYLYLSKCYHEMSKLERFNTDPDYKKADREALKYAVKFRKKDKENEHFSAHEDYWRELNSYAMESGMNWYEQEKYPKARMIFSRMVSYDPSNPGAWQMLALCQARSRMMRDAQESMQHALEAYEQVKAEDEDLRTLTEDQKKLFKISLIEHSDLLAGNGLQDSARVVLELGYEHFQDDPEYNMLYNELN